MAAPTSLLKGFARTVATLKPDPLKRITVSDPDERGLYVRITPKGSKTFTIVARNPQGKQIWAAIPDGDCQDMPLEAARALAREGVKRIKKGLEPFPEDRPEETFGTVADNFIDRYVKKQGLRSAPEVERVLNKYVRPEWKDRSFIGIRRGDVARLLDSIEDDNGPVQADRVLAHLSKMFNWYASREDDYSSPVVRGMRRANAGDRARERILTDEEIRAAWVVADGSGAFGSFVQLLLLTAQRRAKVIAIKWEEVSDSGVWTIPMDAREKGNAGEIQLSTKAKAVLAKLTPVKDNPHVFAGRGKTAMAASHKLKVAFDEKSGLKDWTIHDLRRTAKSLMSRAGVRPDISERVLGHVIGGVEGIYDRHSYADEKAEALEKLAGLVELIVNPPVGNVIELKGVA